MSVTQATWDGTHNENAYQKTIENEFNEAKKLRAEGTGYLKDKTDEELYEIVVGIVSFYRHQFRNYKFE